MSKACQAVVETALDIKNLFHFHVEIRFKITRTAFYWLMFDEEDDSVERNFRAS